LPGLDPNAPKGFSDASRISVLALGLQPFVLTFGIIEWLSFVVPPWRRLRRGGTAGRRKLNMLAIGLGVIFAFLQGVGIAIALQRQAKVVTTPGIAFVLSTSLTLIAGAAFSLLIAQLISRRGFGNGFCLVLFVPLTWSMIMGVYRLPSPSGHIFDNALEPFVWIALIGWLVRMLLRPPTLLLQDQQEVSVSLPAFPQGTFPLLATYIGLNLYNTIHRLFQEDAGQSQLQSSLMFLAIAISITILSVATFQLFSSRKRLESNLPAGILPPGSKIPAGWWLTSTALLVAAGAGLPAGMRFLSFRFAEVLTAGSLIVLTAWIFDLVAEYRFRLKYNGNVVSALEMDNVYGASYLRGCLANQGIDSLIRAFHYRSQGFFFSPIAKMEILVPSEALKRTQEVIQTSRLEIL
jgi:SecY translocase